MQLSKQDYDAAYAGSGALGFLHIEPSEVEVKWDVRTNEKEASTGTGWGLIRENMSGIQLTTIVKSIER